MDLRRMPILRELFLQWRRNRASIAEGAAKRPFSRDWERLLEDAHLLSAEARAEADRDARTLEDRELVEIRSMRYRRYQIERVTIPLSAEPQLRALFADELPVEGGLAVDLTAIDWHPHLAFLRTQRCSVTTDDLLKLNVYFHRESKCEPVPLKERSLEIFGDEKRLDALRLTSLFGEGRLALDQLHCFPVAEPLGWQRGLAGTAHRSILVLENLATWHSYSRWNLREGAFSAVVYGGGNRFIDSAVRLADIFDELDVPDATRAVCYFGDLDWAGLRIPQLASVAAERAGLPAIRPHRWSYRHLLGFTPPSDSADSSEPVAASLTWLGDLAESTRRLLSMGTRLAQEHIGHDYLARYVYTDMVHD